MKRVVFPVFRMLAALPTGINHGPWGVWDVPCLDRRRDGKEQGPSVLWI